MLLSLLVLATNAGAKRPMPRLALPEMLLSFLLAQLTISLPRRTGTTSKHSRLGAERPLSQPAPPGLLLSVPLAPLPWNVAPTSTRWS